MATYAEMEVGKESSLFAEIQEIEKAVEQLLQVLEINSATIATEETAPYTPAQTATEQKLVDMIHRLKTSRRTIAESTQIIKQLVKLIGE